MTLIELMFFLSACSYLDLDISGRHGTDLDVKFITELSKKTDTLHILTNSKLFSDSARYVQHLKHFLVVGEFPRDSAKIDSLVFTFLDTCKVARKFIARYKKVAIVFYLLEEKFYNMGTDYLGKNQEKINGEYELAFIEFENKKLKGYSFGNDLNSHSAYADYNEPVDRLNLTRDSITDKIIQ
ncbi:MAG: hypothetical protein ACOVO1_02980 [Chitinophagaceae bacterium]